MSHYSMTPGQKRYLKKKYAEEAELAKDDGAWDTPHDEPMSLAEAQQATRKEKKEWSNRNDSNSA